MPDPQKGRKSWLERLTSPSESEVEEQEPTADPEQPAGPAPAPMGDQSGAPTQRFRPFQPVQPGPGQPGEPGPGQPGAAPQQAPQPPQTPPQHEGFQRPQPPFPGNGPAEAQEHGASGPFEPAYDAPHEGRSESSPPMSAVPTEPAAAPEQPTGAESTSGAAFGWPEPDTEEPVPGAFGTRGSESSAAGSAESPEPAAYLGTANAGPPGDTSTPAVADDGATLNDSQTDADNAVHADSDAGAPWEGTDAPVSSSPLETDNPAHSDGPGLTGGPRPPWESPAAEPSTPEANAPAGAAASTGSASNDDAARSAADVAEQERRRVEQERQQQVDELQHRWLVTQAQILDDPRDAVREAGLLIGDALQFLTTTLAAHRDRIEGSWKNDSELSTDELRDIMQRYRTLFQYVLSVTQIPEK